MSGSLECRPKWATRTYFFDQDRTAVSHFKNLHGKQSARKRCFDVDKVSMSHTSSVYLQRVHYRRQERRNVSHGIDIYTLMYFPPGTGNCIFLHAHQKSLDDTTFSYMSATGLYRTYQARSSNGHHRPSGESTWCGVRKKARWK